MQLRRFIKILLCTTRHYTPATAKDVRYCSPAGFFFSPFLQTTFLLLTGFTLVAVVMEECHISL